MKKLAIALACLAATSLLLGGEENKEATQLDKANDVLNEIMQTPEKSIPHDLLDKAVCVGIVPSELKFAFIVGGSYGRGVMVCRSRGTGPWGAPSLFQLGAGSVGFQIGGKATDIVFIVMNPKGAKKLVSDNVKLGADASVAGGPVGRSAEGATDAAMQAEILSYSRSRGLFAGVSLAGAVLKQDKDANEKLYGKAVDPKDALIHGTVRAPHAARPLISTLTKYSPHGGAKF